MAVDKRGRKLPKGIRQRGNTFEGRFMYNGCSYAVKGETVTETQKNMTELKYQLLHGQYIARTNITFDQWFNEWIDDYIKPRRKLGTLQTYQWLYNGAVRDAMGNIPLQNLTVDSIEQIYKKLQKQHGYSDGSMEVIRAMIKGCLKVALKKQLIKSNPAALADLPQVKGQEKKKRLAMTKEQQALFMQYAADDYLYNLFGVLLRTGLRNGEIRGLKYSDIDRKNNVLHIRRTIKYVVGVGMVEDTPKSKTSLRDIPLTDDLKKIFDAQKRDYAFKIENISGYVFTDPEGAALGDQILNREIDRIVCAIRAAGHEFPDITAHVFRHTFATRAIEAGMPPQVLKTIMGHSSLGMTMDLYSHVMPDVKAQEMEKIANIF